MIRPFTDADFLTILDIINDAAQAYRGVIPSDCWHEPYMRDDELARQIESGVEFRGYAQGDALCGVMGNQQVRDVTLIRHAYVRTASRNRGIGAALLMHLRTLTSKPILIGTWAAADWAIRFYENHGFVLADREEKDFLLRKYWSIPQRQVETSVVLVETGHRPA